MATIRVIAGRHANAEPAEEPGSDLGRVLSNAGRQQTKQLAAKLYGIHFSRVLSSPAVRAMQTAADVTGVMMETVQRVPELFTPEGPDGLLIDKMFDMLRYQPARVYLDHPLNNGCIDRFSENAGAAIDDILAEHDKDETVAIFGHAVFTPLTFLSLVPKGQKELRDALLDMNMGEAAVFEVVITDGIVTEVNFLD